MRALIVLLLLGALSALMFTLAEPFAPRASLEEDVAVIGHATPVSIHAQDRGTGLARVWAQLVPSGGGTPIVVLHEDYARRSWSGSGVHEVTVSGTVDAAAVHMPEGPATLEVWATDYSWMARFRHRPIVARSITIDLTPPRLEVLSSQHVVRLGGADAAVYRVGADARASSVQVGDVVFPGVAGVFADPELRFALFAVLEHQPTARPVVVATDAAGNQSLVALDVEVRPRTFAQKTLELDDGFLAHKVPELLQENGLPPTSDLVAGYLRINRELRVATEAKLRELCAHSAVRPLWEGAFLRLPNGAPLSSFADRRTYVYHGQEIDHQTHLGFDLASLKRSPVPAANNGTVVFAGPLGIYGNTIVLDHGLGLFSLYGHLSEISVAAGTTVSRGATIGKTGETGLAGGDHLHFSTMLHGRHVDPVEWWDAHWIHDHVELRLQAYPRTPQGPS